MTKNPLFNAFAALVYIILVALVMRYMNGPVEASAGNFLVPVMVLSIFTLSAAVMGYLFLSQPLRMYLDGNKQGGVRLFLQTVGVFAVITVLVLLAVSAGTFS